MRHAAPCRGGRHLSAGMRFAPVLLIAIGAVLFSGMSLIQIIFHPGVDREKESPEGRAPAIMKGRGVEPGSIPVFIYPPIVSDVTPSSFRVSWVNDQPVNASVEYCIYSPGVCDQDTFPGTHSLAYDDKEMLSSGASIVSIGNLVPGTTYYFRAVAKNASGGTNTYPPAPPYPSVTTKTDTNLQVANPTFQVGPYNDKNGNYQWDATIDEKVYNFLVYLNHSGAGTLVTRGSGDSGWICTIDSNNLRSDTPAGSPHPLHPGDTLTFFIVGLHDDGSGVAVWSNWTASYTIPDPMISPVQLLERTEHQIPEFRISPLMIVIPLLPVFIFAQRRCFSI